MFESFILTVFVCLYICISERHHLKLMMFGKYEDKCPKILYTRFSNKMAYENNADSDQTAPEGQGHILRHFVNIGGKGLWDVFIA